MRVFTMGLRGKSVLVLGSLILTALLVMGGATYYQAINLAIDELLVSTGKSIDKDVIEIQSFIRSSHADLMVIADTPPISGIIRARENKGIDPLTGDRTEYWHARLEQIFGAFLANHPEYYQLRYLDGKGDEIVRTDRIGDTIKNTPRPELQNKAQYPYFSETIRLKPNEVYYSEVTLNREHGEIQVPHTPVFRIATPVYDAASAVWGVVVVNLFAEAMFSPARTAPQGTKKYLVNQNGYFLVHPDRTKEYGFDLGFDYRITDAMDEYGNLSDMPDRKIKYHKNEHHVDGYREILYDTASASRSWTLLYEIPESVALGKIYPARNIMLIVGFFIATISLTVLTRASTRKILTPILRLSKTIRKLEAGDLAARVAEDGLVDEIGELAASINRMADTIDKNINEIYALNRITVAASSSLSIDEISRNSLNAIMELQLLKFGKKAAIFVADNASRTLRLVASRGFSEAQKSLDAVVPYGDCLCGRAAVTGETISTETCCDNPFHTRTYAGITPHGHLIVPLKSGDTVLGVLVLYLAAGTKIAPKELRLYLSIADVLAVSLQNAVNYSNIERLKHKHGLILNCLGEGIYEVDLQGNCTFINAAAEKLLGWEWSELSGKHVHSYVHYQRPDGTPYPAAECPIYAAAADGITKTVNDDSFWRKDGTCFPVGYTSTPIVEAGRIIGAVVVFRDITEHKKMENAIRESRERYLSLYEGIDDALFVHGMTTAGYPGNFLEVNNIACRLLGYSRDELLALTPADIDAPDTDTDMISIAEQVAAGKSVTFNQTHVAKDGRRIPVEIRSRMFMLQGRSAVISMARDITDRKRAEEQLEAAKAFSDDLINSSPGVLFCFTQQGHFLRWNTMLETSLEYPRDVIARMQPLDIIAPEDRARAEGSIEETFRLGNAEVELTLLTAGGRRVPYQILGHAIQVDNLPALLGVGIDITERKKTDGILKEYSRGLEEKVSERTREIEGVNIKLQATNKELELRRVEAESATRAKSDFLANMSHELRTPLNSILGFSEIMRDGLAGEVNVQQREYLNDVWESGSHLLRLINDILDISKIEAGKMELDTGETDLNTLLNETLVFFREKAARHTISLHAEVAADISAIIADERKIKQVLINLLTNALKFTPDGGEVGVCTTREGDEVQVSVWDTGIGIAPQDLGRLFQPFQQLESVLTKKFEGTGLGLHLCRMIVELHGGRIWVESTPGQGSRFTFAIPIVAAAENAEKG